MTESMTAQWIWYPGAREAVNFHCRVRKTMRLRGTPRRATLRICAYTDYRLWINGQYVARGPVPGEPTSPLFDTHDVTRRLRPGPNVIAVLCYNRGVGCHWQHRGPGGLIAQLDAIAKDGSVVVPTDGTWRVLPAESHARTAPRMFWSMGFAEIYDATLEPRGWTEAGFDDRDWMAPEVIGQALAQPWRGLQPRDIPLLREAFTPAATVEQGRCTIAGIHAVSFRALLPPGRTGLVYAETWIRSGTHRDAVLRCMCDDAFKVFLNGRLALEQNYNETFAGTRVWRGRDVYDQIHYGMTGTHAPCQTQVALRDGWNRMTVVVDQSEIGWGFAMVGFDPAFGQVVDLPFAADRKVAGRWTIAGPLPSTGLNDSLDKAVSSLNGLPRGTKRRLVDSRRCDGVTDLAALMTLERRSDVSRAVEGNAAVLNAGEFCVADLGKVRVGYPVLRAVSERAGLLDVSSSNTLPDDRGLRLYQNGMLKTVDRVRTARGVTDWQPLHSRSGRYLHISCRKGRGVRVENLGIVNVGYPVEPVAEFECSDPLLNRVWDVSRYTTQLVMQYGYQDCLRREQGTLNHQSFNYASRAAACCFGDTRLARRALRQAIANQYDNGWFDSHGISSPNSDDVTQCFSWAVFLKDYLLYSGDRAFAHSLFQPMEDMLRFFGKMVNRHGLIDGRNMHVYRTGQLIYVDDACSYREKNGYTTVDVRNAEIFGFSLMYYSGLNAASRIATALGLDERADDWRRHADRVRASCNRRFWDRRKGLYTEWILNDRPCRRHHPIVQMYALFHGLCEEHHRRRLMDFVVHRLGLPEPGRRQYPLTTFNGYHYYLELLFGNGRDRMALDLMRRVYGRWVEAGGTAFAEWFHPVGSFANDRLGPEFEVHAYGTGGHVHFYENILGVRPLEPGFAKVRLAPKTGGLDWARGKIATPRGPLRIAWHAENGRFRLDADLPDGVAWEVDPPRGLGLEAIRVRTRHRARVHPRRRPSRE